MNEYLMFVPPAVAAAVAGIKYVWPKLPKWAPLVLAPLLPALADAVTRIAGQEGTGTTTALALGALAVFCREVVDQSRKVITPPAPPAP